MNTYFKDEQGYITPCIEIGGHEFSVGHAGTSNAMAHYQISDFEDSFLRIQKNIRAFMSRYPGATIGDAKKLSGELPSSYQNSAWVEAYKLPPSARGWLDRHEDAKDQLWQHGAAAYRPEIKTPQLSPAVWEVCSGDFTPFLVCQQARTIIRNKVEVFNLHDTFTHCNYTFKWSEEGLKYIWY